MKDRRTIVAAFVALVCAALLALGGAVPVRGEALVVDDGVRASDADPCVSCASAKADGRIVYVYEIDAGEFTGGRLSGATLNARAINGPANDHNPDYFYGLEGMSEVFQVTSTGDAGSIATASVDEQVTFEGNVATYDKQAVAFSKACPCFSDDRSSDALYDIYNDVRGVGWATGNLSLGPDTKVDVFVSEGVEYPSYSRQLAFAGTGARQANGDRIPAGALRGEINLDMTLIGTGYIRWQPGGDLEFSALDTVPQNAPSEVYFDVVDLGERSELKVTVDEGLVIDVEQTGIFAGLTLPTIGDPGQFVITGIPDLVARWDYTTAGDPSTWVFQSDNDHGGEAEIEPTECDGQCCQLDYGDAPDAITGTATGNYNTVASDNGPSHVIVPNLRLGVIDPDADSGILQDSTATADDLDGIPDDEDGVTTLPDISNLSTSVPLSVDVFNNTGLDATLACWIDFNADGDFLDAGEGASAIVGSSAAQQPTALTFTGFASPTPGDTVLRCRIANEALEVSSATGPAATGEVEDYQLLIEEETEIGTWCPVNDPSVAGLQTDLLGTGQGDWTKGFRTRKLAVPDYQNVAELYGQLAAVDVGTMRFVRFRSPDKTNIKISDPTSYAFRTYAVNWWGAELGTAPYIKGQFFWGRKANKSPRAFVLWPTYNMAEPYANVFETFEDGANNHVYWDTANGWVDEVTETLTLPQTQAEGATLIVKVAIVDNNDDDRPVVLTVTAGGVTDTWFANGPDAKATLNLVELTLPNLPAGTDEVEITLYSPQPFDSEYGTGEEGGDSAAMIGATASYVCEDTSQP